MSRAEDISELRGRLANAIEEFKLREGAIAQELDGSTRAILERPTRRFLVDRFLQALDWDVENPRSVREEARARTAKAERLYFDYIGLHPGDTVPALLVEAKAVDAPTPRRGRQATLTPWATSVLLAEAINTIKRKETPVLIADWIEFLRDLSTYVQSLPDPEGKLHRVMITSGKWVIVFEDPVSTFCGTTIADENKIHCLLGFDDIVANSQLLYDLIYRPRLVDVLPPVIEVQKAISILRGAAMIVSQGMV